MLRVFLHELQLTHSHHHNDNNNNDRHRSLEAKAVTYSCATTLPHKKFLEYSQASVDQEDSRYRRTSPLPLVVKPKMADDIEAELMLAGKELDKASLIKQYTAYHTNSNPGRRNRE